MGINTDSYMGLSEQKRVWEAEKTEAVSGSRKAGGRLEVSERLNEAGGLNNPV